MPHPTTGAGFLFRFGLTAWNSLVPCNGLYCVPANFTPDAVWPVSSGRLPHFVTGTNVTTCFSHRSLLYRGFIVGSLSFSSTVLTYRNRCSRFSLAVHHTGVSARCSVRWFDGCPGRPPSEGLSTGLPIVLHPFQSIQPQGLIQVTHRVRQGNRTLTFPQNRA